MCLLSNSSQRVYILSIMIVIVGLKNVGCVVFVDSRYDLYGSNDFYNFVFTYDLNTFRVFIAVYF